MDQQAQSRVLTPPPHTMLIMADLGGAGWDGDEHLLCQVKVWKVKGWLSSKHILNRTTPFVCRCALGVWSVSPLTCPKGQSGTVWRVWAGVSVWGEGAGGDESAGTPGSVLLSQFM